MEQPPSLIKTFRKGEIIFHEGADSRVAYLIQKGSVQVYRVLGDKRAVLDVLREGEILGEMGVISGGVRTATAEAMTHVELMVLTESVVAGLLGQCPKIIQFLTRLLVKRLRKADQRVLEQTYTSPFTSICSILDLMHQAAEPSGRPLRYFDVCDRIKGIVLITQSEIDIVLSRLASAGLIAITSQDAAEAEPRISLADPVGFLDAAGALSQKMELGDAYFAARIHEYVDLLDIARDAGVTPEEVCRTLTREGLPAGSLFLSGKAAKQWAELIAARGR